LRSPTWLRRVAVATSAALVGGTVAGLALLGSAGAAGATSTFTFTTLAGPLRWDTAAATALAAYPAGANTVIVATGFNFPDALAANYLAGLDNAPVLLTTTSAPVPPSTLSAIATLHAKNVIIVGGTSAVGNDVQTQLAGTTSTAPGGGPLAVTRYAGGDRFGTDEAIVMSPGAPTSVSTGILATGDNFPDALSGGSLAFAKHYPIILTDGSQPTLSAEAQTIIADEHITNLIVLGGSSAINPSQYTGLPGINILAVEAGSDRSQTSQLLAQYEISNQNFNSTLMDVANGFDTDTTLPPGTPAGFSSDALAGGAYAGIRSTPILLTLNPTTPEFACSYAETNAATLSAGTIFGGSNAITPATVTALAICAGAPAIPAVTPGPGISPGGASGLGAPPSSNGPDLISASITSNGFSNGLSSTVQYVFDKAVGGVTTADYGLFGFTNGAAGNTVPAFNCGNDPNPNAVDCSFTVASGNPATFTLATVGNTAPSGLAGAALSNNLVATANPLGSALLSGAAVNPASGSGQVSGPQLVKATYDNPSVCASGSGVTYQFDEGLSAAPAPASFVLYNGAANGLPIAATGVAAAPAGSNSVDACFAAGVVVSAAYWYGVGSGGVLSAAGGAPNPEGGVTGPVAQGAPGSTLGPTLTGVTESAPQSNIFLYTFNQPVTVTSAFPAEFKLYTAATTPSFATALAPGGSPNVVAATFGTLNATTAPAEVLGAVAIATTLATATLTTSAAPAVALVQAVSSAPVAVTLGAGPTAGPVLISATVGPGLDVVDYTFNEAVTAVAPIAFFVQNSNGVAVFAPAAAAFTIIAGGDTVEMPFASASAASDTIAGVVAPGGTWTQENGAAFAACTNNDGTVCAPASVPD